MAMILASLFPEVMNTGNLGFLRTAATQKKEI